MRPYSVSSGHEGKIVTDGVHLFRIVNGQRRWLSATPPEILLDLQIEAERLRRAKAIARENQQSVPRYIPSARKHPLNAENRTDV